LLKQIHNNDIQYEFSQPTQVSYTKATANYIRKLHTIFCNMFW